MTWFTIYNAWATIHTNKISKPTKPSNYKHYENSSQTIILFCDFYKTKKKKIRKIVSGRESSFQQANKYLKCRW